jgi:two-component system NtrC family sensor kinase
MIHRLSIRNKMLIAFVGLAVVPMGLLGGLTYLRSGRILEKRITAELQVEVATGAEALQATLETVSRDVNSLSRFLGRRLTARMTDQQWRLVEEEFLQTIRDTRSYYQVRFISTDGMENLRVNHVDGQMRLVPQDELQYKGDRYYVQEALTLPSGATYISHLDFNEEHGQLEMPLRLVVRVATTVWCEEQLRGLVVINVFGEQLLQTLAPLKALPGSRIALLDEQRRFIELSQTDGGPSFRTGPTVELAQDLGVALLGGESEDSGTGDRPAKALLARTRVQAGQQEPWELLKIYPRDLAETDLEGLLRTTALFALPLAILSALLAIMAASTFSRPIGQLSRLSEAIASGDYGTRCQAQADDEIGQLARSLNIMADSLEKSRDSLVRMNQGLQSEVERKVAELKISEQQKQETARELQALERQLLAADRLAALGMLSATVAHEIGNPLAGLKTRLQLIQRRTSADDPLSGDLVRILELVDRLAQILGHLTGYLAPASEPELHCTELGKVLRDLGFILKEEADRRGTRFELTLPDEEIWLCCPGQHLHQIFMNLILNALQAADSGGEVLVRADREIGRAWVEILDNGPGFHDPENPSHFEPLTTTRTDGTGLGLAIVKRLVTEMQGQVQLGNRPGSGARVTTYFPLGDAPCTRKS